MNMNPAESNETPKYSLPAPAPESGEVGGGRDNGAVEQGLKGPEIAAKPKPQPTSSSKNPVVDFQLKNFAAPKKPSVASSTSTTDNPQIADDDDLIEKEWVAKAKQIIEANREDPHKQSDEMTVFKADYMKKRYNKVVKAAE
jgi:hypothetical protein